MSNLLSDLLQKVFNSNEVHYPTPDELREVSLSEIDVNPHQPRKQFNEEELQELALSIQSIGLIHPPLVRPKKEGHGYELIAGERRLRAAKLAGLSKIPVLISHHTEEKSAEAALIENMQRVDLNAIEVAQALKKIMTDFNLSQDEIAHKVSKKRSTVANYLRLLGLHPSIQSSISGGQITMGHAKVILSVEGETQQQQLHDRIVEGRLTVREAEQEILKRFQKTSKKSSKTGSDRDIHVERLELELQRKLGTKVLIQDRKGAGSIVIEYYNLDDLERLLTCFDIRD